MNAMEDNAEFDCRDGFAEFSPEGRGNRVPTVPSGRLPESAMPEYASGGMATVVDLSPDGLPFISQLGEVHRTSIGNEPRHHTHPGMVEILLCRRGRGVQITCDGRTLPLPPGTVMAIQPDVPHTLTNYPKSLLTVWIWFRLPKRGEALSGFTHAQTRWLVGKLRSLPITFPANRDLEQSFLRLWRLHRETPRKAPERRLVMREAVMRLLMDVLDAPGRNADHGSDAMPLASLLADIRANPEKAWPLDELIARAAMSVPVLTERFRRLTGLPPHQFVVACRIEKAREALAKSDLGIADIATSVGYATAEHFASVFHRETGMSPREWRKRHRH